MAHLDGISVIAGLMTIRGLGSVIDARIPLLVIIWIVVVDGLAGSDVVARGLIIIVARRRGIS